jgi:hypothetical protein
MDIFLKELKNFSKENWWVYCLLIITLWVVIYTNTGNPFSITLLFFTNFIWNLFIMAAMNSYSEKNNITWVLYHVIATLTFTWLGIYGFIFQDQFQYIFWQIAYLLAALKAYMYYNYQKDIKILNEKTFVGLNVILFWIFLYFFPFQTQNILINFAMLQALGFSFATTGLVSINDKFRFWFSYIGSGLIMSGSAIWVYVSYMSSISNPEISIDGIALWFCLLSMTVFVYFSKLLKKYI